ncbi:hypothetical protein [Methylophilus sp.]|uniref:hypothetical protein n=1 Tax=Methylophilus sp. TaxID=29541 RepID=UPI000D4FB8AF|nr:hypothetical protein [Methylophilus sp.]PPD11553.1 MAG: hypothetical protein CTY26_08505 [Methylophilus sp.]
MSSPLSDLDELVLKCRNQKAKDYIREAVACYKSGAFRSSIVSTWIAVSFDIIDKLKELSLSGDSEAEQQINDFDKARRIGDIVNSLKFEREILAVCRDKLELISPVEFIDLERLQQDRNRCAHPSMSSDGEMFNPPAELARLHIRSAVDHLLKHPPAQGKYALDTLLTEINSEYFPTDLNKALIAFDSSPLKRARESLVRNLIIILLKKLINDVKDYKEAGRISTALNAIGNMHRECFSRTLTEKLSSIVRILDATKLGQVTPLLTGVQDSWSYFEPDIKQKLETYVENIPKDKFDDIDYFISIEGLKRSAEKRIHSATREELKESFFIIATEQLGNRIIEIFSDSSSFDQANGFAQTVIRYASDYNKDQIEKIIKAAGKNEQIKYSFEIGAVINALRKNKKVNDQEVDNWLHESNLERFSKSLEGEPKTVFKEQA